MTAEQKEKIQQLRRQGVGYGQVAACLGISKEAVKSFCRRNPAQGFAQDTSADNTVLADEGIVCKQCGKLLTQKPNQKPKRFCSDDCRLAWWRKNESELNKKALYLLRCAYCGKEFESYGNKARKYCGHACYIKDRFGRGAHDQ